MRSNTDLQAIATSIASANYFQPAGTAPSAAQIEAQLTELDTLVETSEPEDIKDLKEKIDAAGSDADKIKGALKEKVAGLGAKGDGKFKEFA